ncbi:MAG: hypothetical protein ABL951_07110 [Alphaproteobacteria bacterium]
MSDYDKCPIWGTPATFEPKLGDYECVNSPRAGGAYRISGTAIAVLKQQNDVLIRARLTTWLVDQRRLGQERPEVNSNTIELVMQRQPLPVHERADRLLKYLAQCSPVIGHCVEFSQLSAADRLYPTMQTELTYDYVVLLNMLAWSEALSRDSEIPELIFLLEYLVNKQWVRRISDGHNGLVVTPEGYARIAELDARNKDSSQGFVAMWFPDKDNKDYDLINNAYTKGIYPGMDQARYTPFRVDRDEHNDQITDKIIAEIKRSKLLVADFTHGNKGIRGGVYYEAGFALGLNIPVIFTCLKKRFSAKRIHFDIQQQNFILWETPEDLCEKLKNRITGSAIGWGPNPPSAKE